MAKTSRTMLNVIAARELIPTRLDGVRGGQRAMNWLKVPSAVKRGIDYLVYGSNLKKKNSLGRVVSR